MPTRQSAAIVRAAASALGVDLDLTRWAIELRRDVTAPDSLDALSAQVEDLARQADVALLHRDAAELDALVTGEAFPIVALLDGARRIGVVIVAHAGAALHAVEVATDGSTTPVALPEAGVVSALARLSGARDIEEPRIICFVPVSVAPTLGAADDVAIHDVATAPRSPLRRLWQLVVRERRDVLLVWGYAAFAGLLGLVLPLGVQQIVTMVSGRLLLQSTWILVGFVVLGTLGVGVLQMMQLSVVETIQQRVFARMALEFAFRVPRLPYEVAARENLPEMMNRFFEAVNIQKSLSKLLLDLSASLLTILFGLALLTLYHPYFTFFSTALVLGLALIFWWTAPRGLQTSLMESKHKYQAMYWLEELARTVTVFKFAGRSPLPIGRIDDLVAGYLRYRRKHFRVLVQQTASVIGFKTLITGALLVLGIVLVQSNQITLGQFVASEIVIVLVLAGIEKLVLSLSTVYDVLTAVEKAGHVTDLPLETAGGLAPRGGPGPGMTIELRGVSYRCPGDRRPALRDVTLTIAPGERLGVTGYDGTAQSTLLELVGGLLDGFDGAVSFDGVPLRALDRGALRAMVGQVLSPAHLFDGTVEENVTVGRPEVSTRDVLRALDLVGLREWADALPDGLRTRVINGGRGLSSSVANRLAVAQGIAGQPRLIVLDDFFRNIEPAYRRQLVRCLTDRASGWTMVLVSHDPAFLTACDRVVVLENGRLRHDGSTTAIAERRLPRRPRSVDVAP